MQITHLLQQKETSKCMLCVFVLQIDLRRVWCSEWRYWDCSGQLEYPYIVTLTPNQSNKVKPIIYDVFCTLMIVYHPYFVTIVNKTMLVVMLSLFIRIY
jgi:hypothetical protein